MGLMGRMIMLGRGKLALCSVGISLLISYRPISAAPPVKAVLAVRDYLSNQTSLPIEGVLKAGKTWVENGDTNIVVVMELQAGKPCDRGYVHRIFGYRFSKRDSQWKNLWTIRDQASGCQDLQYFDSTLNVTDVDGNGFAETLFFYSLFSDGTDPQNLKMMFHFNGAKMPIRGRIPVTEEDALVYEFKPDAKLASAPPIALKFALSAWKGFLARNFKEEVPSSALK